MVFQCTIPILKVGFNNVASGGDNVFGSSFYSMTVLHLICTSAPTVLPHLWIYLGPSYPSREEGWGGTYMQLAQHSGLSHCGYRWVAENYSSQCECPSSFHVWAIGLTKKLYKFQQELNIGSTEQQKDVVCVLGGSSSSIWPVLWKHSALASLVTVCLLCQTFLMCFSFFFFLFCCSVVLTQVIYF